MEKKNKVDLWINQLLTIEYENGQVYYSNIMSEDEEVVYIQLPKNKSYTPVREASGEVNVYYFNELNEMIGFKSVIRESNGKITLAKPNIESTWKVQRRNYFRVPASLTVAIEVSPEETRTFITKDISGGGLVFFSKESDPFKFGDELLGSVILDYRPSPKTIPFKGRVVGVRLEDMKKYCVAVEFMEMKELVRVEIIRYCYKRQFEIRDRTGEVY